MGDEHEHEPEPESKRPRTFGLFDEVPTSFGRRQAGPGRPQQQASAAGGRSQSQSQSQQPEGGEGEQPRALTSSSASSSRAAVVGPRRPGAAAVGPRRPTTVGPTRPPGLVGPPRPSFLAKKREAGGAGPRSANSQQGLNTGSGNHEANNLGGTQTVGDGLVAGGSGGGGVKSELSGAPKETRDDSDPQLAPEAAWARDLLRCGAPCTQLLPLKEHRGGCPVQALALDASGARFASGDADSKLFWWDFAGFQRPPGAQIRSRCGVPSPTAPELHTFARASSLKPFRDVTVVEGNPVHSLAWSARGDMLATATSTPQARIYDREGALLGETVQGDRYVFDLTRTNGHVAAITSVAWHPVHANAILTGALDGSVRLWSTETLQRKNLAVFKCRDDQNKNLPVSALAVTPPNASRHMFAAGTQSGSVHVWSIVANAKLPVVAAAQRNQPKPSIGVFEGIHEGAISSLLLFERGGHLYLLTRSTDSTMKLFDLRDVRTKLQEDARVRSRAKRGGADSGSVHRHPCLVHEWLDLPARSERTMCGVSPDGSLAFTGVEAGTAIDRAAMRPGELRVENSGFLFFFRTDPLALSENVAAVLPVSDLVSAEDPPAGGAVVTCVWHAKLNQIVVGTNRGGVHVFFDFESSQNGALLASSGTNAFAAASGQESSQADGGVDLGQNRKRRRDTLDDDIAQILQQRADAAGAIPGHELKRAIEKNKAAGRHTQELDKFTARGEGEPTVEVKTKAGFGGRIGTAGSAERAMLADQLKIDEDLRGVDVRDAILAHQPAASVFTAAYNDTQPQTILDYDGHERELIEEKARAERQRLKERQREHANRRY